ncbi:DNA adenine methyltransferase YhdJ [Planctomyces sp. SH-PL14]|nr:DNA methyltransferase [Planctomyces sp. SH-PL14]AMV20084.1 DNA adenine methyltransferase YhdJ [Planctomyces sp. SH-PL14]
MSDPVNTILNADCIAGMNALQPGSVDLVFADPPFNIGYDYDVYNDSLDCDKYIHWCRDWMQAVHRALADNGTFWLAIGDEYAAELKIEAKKLGFHCRSWVIWYYTFGVNCARKFTRSHAHLFHFVKDPANFVFRSDELENRVPSARQLVYADARANPRGRLPDDTWILPPANAAEVRTGTEELPPQPAPADANDDTPQTWTLRPQDLAERFQPNENTWYFPRVAGTFKERAGFHGCQMPEQLLARIIRVCSEPDALVMDPFSGSATTAAVAKKLGRRYLAFDLSEQYVDLGLRRLAGITSGDRMDGAEEPLMSAPKTSEGKPRRTAEKKRPGRKKASVPAVEET